MKNMVKLFGIIAVVAVIGFSMAACEETTDEGTGVDQLEKREIVTAGRLIITGLGAYEGKLINASAEVTETIGMGTVTYSLFAYKTVFSGHDRVGNFVMHITEEAIVTGGQAELKVYGYTPGYVGAQAYSDYGSNHQHTNVEFSVNIIRKTGSNSFEGEAGGTVTVNFANGQASGAFEPNP